MSATAECQEQSTSGEVLHAWRCWRCGKLLARLRLAAGCAVEVKCRCGALNVAAVDKAVRTA